jgi:enediyne biosynthesis protein E4
MAEGGAGLQGPAEDRGRSLIASRARIRRLALLALLATGPLSCGGNGGGASSVGPASPTTGAASAGGSGGAGRFRFVDVAAAAGLKRVLLAGRPGKDHLLDSAGAGAAWLDYDRDGRIDAYLVNGWALDGSRVLERGRNALYRNRGDGTFEDVTDAAGVGGGGEWGSGVAVADFDGDGWPDLFVTNFGADILYRNRGDGTFENVAAAAGVESPGWNTGAAFLDADGDGDLDLYVAAYIRTGMDQVLAARRTLSWKGVDHVAPGPFGMPGAPDHFFRSDGHGRFVDATAAAGLEDRALAFGFGVRAVDVDGDGDLDLYVANDSDANYLYRNDGGTFTEVGIWSGAGLDAGSAAQAGMGVAAGDADGDGHVDLFVTNFAQDFSTLYRGDGRGFFEDVSVASGVGPATYTVMSWGTVMADLDCDGDLDIVVANGHIYPQVDLHPGLGQTYAQRNLLLENLGDGRFRDVSAEAGPGFQEAAAHRGLAAGDFDNDGDVDLLITRLDQPPVLLRNDSACPSWLEVALEAPAGTGPVIGARVTVEAGGRRMVRDAASGESYLSAHDPRLHFGLAGSPVADRVEVRWPDGRTEAVEQVPANRVLRMRRGGGPGAAPAPQDAARPIP